MLRWRMPRARSKASIAEAGGGDATRIAQCGTDRRKLLLLAEDHGVDLEEFLAAEELAELHAWLGRDTEETEKDWDPVAL